VGLNSSAGAPALMQPDLCRPGCERGERPSPGHPLPSVDTSGGLCSDGSRPLAALARLPAQVRQFRSVCVRSCPAPRILAADTRPPDSLALTEPSTPKIIVAPGPRAAEGVVLGWLAERLAGGEDPLADLAGLGTPLRLVVPSESLRLHLSAALVRWRGRSLAGLQVQTLDRLARDVLEMAGEPLPTGDALLGVLVRRFARDVPTLARHLDELADGYEAVVGTVRDFLDAGFEPHLADGVAESVLQEDALAAGERPVGTKSERERAEAIARLAARIEEEMAELGLGRSSHLLRRANDLLAGETGARTLLPTRGLLVHGFADATGLRADLIQTLMRRFGATVVLDRPPDPAAADGPVEAAFTRRFMERLATVAGVEIEEAQVATPSSPRLATISAPGADAEAREVARKVRTLLDRQEREDGASHPEQIGVLARSLAPEQPYATALRRHFGRLGIPFSGVEAGPGGTGPLLPAGRRVRALLEILRRGEAVPTDRWLDARTGEGPNAEADAGGLEIRLALRTLGAARLRDAARVRPERIPAHGLGLPIRQGLGAEEREGEDDGEERPGEAPRRRVPAHELRAAVEGAARLVERLRSWPGRSTRSAVTGRAPIAEHLGHLRALLRQELGWATAGAAGDSAGLGSAPDPVAAALRTLEEETPADFPLGYDELVPLLERALEDVGRDHLGGAGAGVALLDVTEARSRTFEHLVVVGLNRGVFPRPIREDPLLADDLRELVTFHTLPDLPVKRRGFDEERHLFAQLLTAAPEVTLSWQSVTEDGSPNPRSPLLDRIEGLPSGSTRPGAGTDGDSARTGPRPAAEHVVAAGLAGDRNAFEALLPVALAEAWSEASSRTSPGTPDGPVPVEPAEPASVTAVAAAQRAILDEMDPDLSTAEGRATRRGLGPYFGFVGPSGESDPRGADLWVTTLERIAACPWQTFLGRVLRIEPTPDPLQAVPGLDPLLVGSVVHGTLEEVVTRQLPEPHAKSLEEADAREPVEVAWPEPDELESILHRRARALLTEEGIALPGLERALAAAARPFVEAARQAEWHPRAPAVLAAEVRGAVTVTDRDGASRALRFRADRIDRMVDRRFPGLRLTDYKTGRPISEAVRQKTRDEHFLRQVEAGERLQAVAYALATGGPLPSMHAGQGRYVFLRPELPSEQREFGVWGSHVPFAEAFAAAARSTIGAWDQGAFFPRLVEPDRDEEPRRCAWCPVREACLRGDSGARRRLATWAERRRQGTLAPELPAPEHPSEATGATGAAEETSRVLLDVWTLPSRQERAGRGGGEDA